MKKLTFLLSLLFTTQGFFSSNSKDFRSLNQNKQMGYFEANFVIQNAISVDLGNNYLFTATIVKTGTNSYSYIGTLTNSGTLVGNTSASFQTQIISGVETIIDNTFTETYSNGQTSSVVKPRHDTVKGVIQNIR